MIGPEDNEGDIGAVQSVAGCDPSQARYRGRRAGAERMHKHQETEATGPGVDGGASGPRGGRQRSGEGFPPWSRIEIYQRQYAGNSDCRRKAGKENSRATTTAPLDRFGFHIGLIGGSILKLHAFGGTEFIRF